MTAFELMIKLSLLILLRLEFVLLIFLHILNTEVFCKIYV